MRDGVVEAAAQFFATIAEGGASGRRNDAKYRLHPSTEVRMRTVVLTIPKEHYPQFAVDLMSWEKATGKDARWMLGDVANPMQTTNASSPITLTCQLDDTFFEQYPEWEQYVTR